MFRKLKQRLRKRALAKHRVSIQQYEDVIEVGTDGGAWSCLPDRLGSKSVVYSFGAGRNISFDLELAEQTGCEVHIFDPTPISIQWVHRQKLPANVLFHEFGVGESDGTIRFFTPKKKSSAHFSPVQRHREITQGDYEAPVLSMQSIMTTLNHQTVDLVKMDIEGGEYDVLPSLLDAGLGVQQILLEFHHNYSTIPLSRTIDAFKLLNKSGFRCIHISDRTYEMAFLRQTR